MEIKGLKVGDRVKLKGSIEGIENIVHGFNCSMYQYLGGTYTI